MRESERAGRRLAVANKSGDEKYTDPKLREEIKEKIKAGDRGGKPGQWSARKAQLLVQEYEKAGGGYTDEERDPSQKSLQDWTDEDWQTMDGQAAIQDGETARYLPKEAWDEMSEEEKRETDRKKREASKKGQQYVSNTEEAKRARKGSQKGDEPIDGYDEMSVEDVKGKLDDLSKVKVQAILDYEKENRNRKTLVEQLERKV